MAPTYKQSIASFERYCNTKIVNAEKFLDDHKNDPCLSTITVDEAKDMILGLKKQFGKMETKWQDEIMDKVEETVYDELEKRVTDSQSKVNKCVETLQKFLNRNDPTSVTSATSVPKAMKLDNSFKPDPGLTVTNTLEEFNAWHRAFVAHHDSNKDYLKAATPEIKRQFLNNCVDSKLQAAMITDDILTMDTPIMGEADSLLVWLKDYFLRDLPLFIRRVHYSNCKQRPKETFRDWWTRKLVKASECELDKVKTEAAAKEQ